MAKDPVCGMQINENEAAWKSGYKGKTYYFCSAHCKSSFDKEPAKYAEDGDDNQEQHHHHH